MEKRKKTNGMANIREYDLHFVIKLLIYKKLKMMGKNCKLEFEVIHNGKRRIVDIVDLDRSIMFEVERKPTEAYIKDFKEFAEGLQSIGIIIDLGKIPKELVKSIAELDKILDTYIQ